MSEFRKDPIVERWVIIATERARRPGNFVDRGGNWRENEPQRCPFCRSEETPLYTNGDVRVISSSWFSASEGTPAVSDGLYAVTKDFGTHEIVIETHQHVANTADLDVEQIHRVVKAYAARFTELEKDPRWEYLLAYKNYGLTAGSRNINHARSHIMATIIKPLRVKEKLAGARQYFEANKRCIYCDLIRQEIQERKRLVWETDHFIAVTPFAARFLFEVWILPKTHSCDFARGVLGCEEDLAAMLKTLLQKIKIGLDDAHYNFAVQTAPLRREDPSGEKWRTLAQDYHWHMELTPRLTRVAGFEKGTGFHICSIPPEATADYLREVEIL